ncbi:hypothetical protein [Streptomyces sp. NPDC057257]|uniref:hypothetical protein n=1 Tax=Streptomyces sp. NPDC057257 TaxID=3346071 RepID=UPI0036303546
MMHDVVLPGVPPGVIWCPHCLQGPRNPYPIDAPTKWQRLLENGSAEAINQYLVADRMLFEHGPYGPEKNLRCPVEILPGPALDGVTAAEARIKARDLMKRLGLL